MEYITVDPVQLIQQIEKHKCIWNTSCEEYSDKVLKDMAWEDTCKIIFNDWDTLDDAVQIMRVRDLKKKWHNIRDYYKKAQHWKKLDLEAGYKTPKRKIYMYAHLLEFLKPYIGPRPRSVNHKRKSHRINSTVKIQEEHLDVESDEDYSDSPQVAEFSTTTTIDTKENLKEFSSLEPMVEVSMPSNEEDTDLMFFKSLLPDVKKLPDNEKIHFKCEIMKLLANRLELSDSQQGASCNGPNA